MAVSEEKWLGNIPKRNVIIHDVSSFDIGDVLKYNFTLSSNLIDDDANYIGVIEDEKRIVLNGYIKLSNTTWSTITNETISSGDSLYLSSTGKLTSVIPTVGIIKKVLQVLSDSEGIVFSFCETTTKKIINFSDSDLNDDILTIENVNINDCIVRKNTGEKIIPDDNIYDFSTQTLTLNFESYNVGTNWKVILF